MVFMTHISLRSDNPSVCKFGGGYVQHGRFQYDNLFYIKNPFAFPAPAEMNCRSTSDYVTTLLAFDEMELTGLIGFSHPRSDTALLFSVAPVRRRELTRLHLSERTFMRNFVFPSSGQLR